jgi:hypothetical protein
MAVRVRLDGGSFGGRFHDLDADPRLLPMDLSMGYEGGAVGTQPCRAAPAREPGRVPQLDAGS